MKWIVSLALVALLLCCSAGSAHRMFIGQQMTLDLFVFFDDGSPAGNAEVRLYQDGKLFAENLTDASGRFTVVLPGRGTGQWQYEVSGGGHSEKGSFNINSSV